MQENLIHIKDLVKQNPGKPLNIILPMAKKIYQKPDMNEQKPKMKSKTYGKKSKGKLRRTRRH